MNIAFIGLPGIDGHDHSLKDYAGARILVIIFTANHCKTAQAYEGRIMQLIRDYQDIFNSKDLDALANALDAEWAGGFPYTILVAPGGQIIQRQMGAIDPMKLKQVIALYPTR